MFSVVVEMFSVVFDVFSVVFEAFFSGCSKTFRCFLECSKCF